MRIVLKISWDALSWEKEFWIDSLYAKKLADKIKEIYEKWLELVIVVWWWNIYRWWDLIKSWINPSDSHNLSMLSTVFNWVVLKNYLEQLWLESEVLDPLWISFLERYNKYKAKDYLYQKKIVICVSGTWNPYFTTDSWWVLRALELDCDMMIKATKVDWIYSSDPKRYDDAKFIKEINYDEFLSKGLKVLDAMSVVLARDWWMKIKVIGLDLGADLYEGIVSEDVWSMIL